MNEDLTKNLATIVENDPSWKWLGGGGFLGNKATGYQGLKAITEFFIEKNIFIRVGSKGLTPPTTNQNEMSKDFIKFLEEKNTYPDLLAKAKRMIEGRDPGHLTDQVLLTFATVLYQLGQETSTKLQKETVSGLLEGGLSELKTVRPDLKEKITEIETTNVVRTEGNLQENGTPESRNTHSYDASYSGGEYSGEDSNSGATTAPNGEATVDGKEKDSETRLRIDEDEETTAEQVENKEENFEIGAGIDQQKNEETTPLEGNENPDNPLESTPQDLIAEKNQKEPIDTTDEGNENNKLQTDKENPSEENQAKEIPTEGPSTEEAATTKIAKKNPRRIRQGLYEVEVATENSGANLNGLMMESLGDGLRKKKKKGVKPTRKNLEDTQRDIAKYDEKATGKPQPQARSQKPEKSGGRRIAEKVGKAILVAGGTIGAASKASAATKVLPIVTGLIQLFI